MRGIGICGIAFIGAAIYAFREYDIEYALKDDLKTVQSVPVPEREAYMQSIAEQLTEFSEGTLYGTDDFTHASQNKYEFQPWRTAFIEVSKSVKKLSETQILDLKAYHRDGSMCDTENSLRFTDKGWTYKTKLKNADGRTMVVIVCKPTSGVGPRVG